MEILRNIKLEGAEGKTILADLFFNMDSFNKPVVIFNHGFKGFKDYGCWNKVAEHFANEGFVFVKFNQSHNGTNAKNPSDFVDLDAFGRNTFSRELFDIGAVIKWIKNNPALPTDVMNVNDISLIGHSRGGSTAILAANKFNDIKKVCSWAAFKNIEERYQGPSFAEWKAKGVVYVDNSRTKQKMPISYEIYEDYMSNADAFSIEKACATMEKPHLIVHGTEDPTVLFQDAIQLKKWNSKAQLHLIPNANHVFGASHPYKNELLPTDTLSALKETVQFLKSN